MIVSWVLSWEHLCQASGRVGNYELEQIAGSRQQSRLTLMDRKINQAKA